MKSVLLKASYLMLSAFFLFSCQGNNGDQGQTKADKSSNEVKTAKRQAVVKLFTADGVDSTMKDAIIFYDSMNNETMVAGGYSDDGKEFFNFTFTGKEPGTLIDPYLTLKGYKVAKVNGALIGFDKNSISGMIQGILWKRDKNGFPIKGDITFKATFQK